MVIRPAAIVANALARLRNTCLFGRAARKRLSKDLTEQGPRRSVWREVTPVEPSVRPARPPPLFRRSLRWFPNSLPHQFLDRAFPRYPPSLMFRHLDSFVGSCPKSGANCALNLSNLEVWSLFYQLRAIISIQGVKFNRMAGRNGTVHQDARFAPPRAGGRSS